MSVTTREYLDRQYGSASNLNARVLLHARFSRNTYGWYRWVLDQFDLPPEAFLLELGGGTGALWNAERPRIPTGWRVLLSDRSPGMVASATEALAGDDRFAFQIIDAQEIPLDDASCDAVVANHMLYHVADLSRTLSEIRRVLRPGGRLYATTIGARHLADIETLVAAVAPGADPWGGDKPHNFILENGVEQLAPYFARAECRRYDDALLVTEVEPLLGYILSTGAGETLTDDHLAEMGRRIADQIERQGHFYILKDSGMVLAQ